jgi:hypothetical protein
MAYNKFTLKETVEKFNLDIVFTEDVIGPFEDVPPGQILLEMLRLGTPQALKISTEKARSELIVAPVLLELLRIKENQIDFFSGIEFNVDKKKGLSEHCDFIITLGKPLGYLSAPLLTIVEAKNDKLNNGLGQCAAEMGAARLFNEKENPNIPCIYGISTNGLNWKFLKLTAQKLEVEKQERRFAYDKNLSQLLGILSRITEPQN